MQPLCSTVIFINTGIFRSKLNPHSGVNIPWQTEPIVLCEKISKLLTSPNILLIFAVISKSILVGSVSSGFEGSHYSENSADR